MADKKDKKTAGGTLLGAMNPWAVRSSSLGPASTADVKSSTGTSPPAAALPSATPGTSTTPDHSTSSYYGRSTRRYPAGCPPLNVQWFHAIDVPKRKAHWIKNKRQPEDAKPPPPPKKYIAFSADDNRSIEAAYQKELEGFEDKGTTLPGSRARGKSASEMTSDIGDLSDAARTTSRHKGSGVKVPVNEDFLFDVDIEDRELAPVYWLGPVYDVRRGSWFYQEGSTLRACEENLAAQLEEGYLKTKPWLYVARDKPEGKAEGTSDSLAAPGVQRQATGASSGTRTRTPSLATSKSSEALSKTKTASAVTAPAFHPESHRLFGQYMNHVATYQDATTAFLSTDSMLSWVTSTMYERFSGGGYMSGVKVVRGYSEPKKTKDDKDKAKDKDEKDKAKDTAAPVNEAEEKRLRALKRRSAPPTTKPSGIDRRPSWDDSGDHPRDGASTEIERRGNQLQRQLSSLMGNGEGRDPEKEEEEIRRREEQEMEDDYNALKGETQGREIEHLVLVTHGIGQLLGLRMESLNFIHDVNMLRKTLKSVYSNSPDLRALNSELPDGPGNCRIQVLPVCWRHLLDFPRRAKKQEQDLSVIDEEDEDEYPALEDITIEGMAFARSLISDLALDILLYQSAYREQISEIVLKESNRIHKLFLDRNPDFKGTVHVIGHSLGSAIMFDILCRQKEAAKAAGTPFALSSVGPTRQLDEEDDITSPTEERPSAARSQKDLSFNFEVQDFYCLGSPIGLFQMLKGRTVAARHLTEPVLQPAPAATQGGDIGNPFGFEYADDSFLAAPSTTKADQRVSSITGLPFSVSSPKVGQLFNIFHPSDPISYRMEPLISPAMKTLKPQPLPYTKKGIFGSVAPQGLTGIGAKVGQSVSGLWSSFSAGIASNLLNRSLGLSQEDVAKLEQQGMQNSDGSGAHGQGHGPGGFNAPTVSANPMEEEVETLFSHFEKKRADMAKDDAAKGDASNKARAASWLREEAKAQRMRREEAKVRALNRNGRVDYSIQESVLDFNPINTIASHMAYWADEDVSHFMMAQLFTGKKPKK